MNCPSCGAEIAVEARHAHLVVCEYCASAVVLDEKAARVSGKMAALAQTPGPLYVGGTGRLRGKNFRVLGRVRYGYAKGYWDEWYLVLEDENTIWVSEDENNFTIEICQQDKTPPADYMSIQPGDTLTLGEKSFHVDEKDVAECEGGEGQLPFAVLTGEKVPFLDLSSGSDFGTVEYEMDGDVRVFLGRRLDIGDVEMDMPRIPGAGDSLDAEQTAGAGTRERIIRAGKRMVDLKCAGCGSPLPVPAPDAKSVACESCGNQLDLTLRRITCESCGVTVPLQGGDAAKSVSCPQCEAVLDVSRPGSMRSSVLAKLRGEQRPRVPVKLGQPFNYDDTTYRVVGHIRYVESWGIERWRWDEFMLYHPDRGYRWLILEDGHFTFAWELKERPEHFSPRVCSRKQKLSFLGKRWQVFEVSENATRVEWVDGELPWVAAVGDQNSYMDAIAPPHLLSAEWTREEMEWYRGVYIPRPKAARALGVDEEQLPAVVGVAPHQPYGGSAFSRQAGAVMLLFGLLFLVFGLGSLFSTGKMIHNVTVTPGQYVEEYLTSPFTVTESNTVCKTVFESSVDNSWVYLEVALINSEDEALLDFSAEMSYYHGRSGGESWSEGSRDDYKLFRVQNPGEYRFLVYGQAGRSENPGVPAEVGKPVVMKTYQGASVARYYLVAGLVCMVVAAIPVIRRASFETRRWGVDDDDDDD